MKICVATDLSASGKAAADRAVEWATKLGGELQLLHVVHDPELAPALSSDVPGDVQRAKDELERFAATAGCRCTVDVRTADDVAAGIVAAAAEASADYLFVGSQGKSAFERLRLGSVATKVLRNSEVPVVCCPHSEHAS